MPPGQGPYTNYPPSGGYMPPPHPGYPPPPQPKKNKGLLVAGIAIGIVLVLGAIGSVVDKNKEQTATTTTTISTSSSITESSNTAPTPTPTPKPVQKTWQTTHTYTGNGDKQTETITVVDNWKIQWNCQVNGAALIAQVYDANTNDMADFDAVDTTCESASPKGESFEHKGGSVYLKIYSGIDWTITIQELE
jgi:hypothetical protein